MSAFLIIVYSICGIYMLLNLKHDIHMLQQNSYRPERYWRWLQGDMSTAWRLVDVALLFILFSTLLNVRFALLLIALTAICKSWIILRKKFKKPLVFTRRVWRIYSVAGFLSVGAFLAVIFSTCGDETVFFNYLPAQIALGTLLLLTIFSWAIVMLSVVILSPVEKAINRKYYNEARDILRQMPDLKIIGITGSYGKTSTKHYLNAILSEKYDVLMTPGSFNTPMGVIRTIREMMKPYNQIFICEMGAKQKGDIKEICDLVNPQMGIITAVGPMHLETFKSIENVQSTKFELADALPSDGFAVINNDFEYCANRDVKNVEAVRYGVSNTDGASFIATDIHYTPYGTSFIVKGPDGFSLPLETRLVGECNISNLLAATVMALHLGVAPQQIQYAVKGISQVEHRLSIRQTPAGTIIDDAFNSNPDGARMAVDVLAHFTEGLRVIVTPGMVELGSKQYELNRQLGLHIGKSVDVAIIVGEYNRKALTDGIEESGFDKNNLIVVDTFAEAQTKLAPYLKKDTTILYENDLPDSFK